MQGHKRAVTPVRVRTRRGGARVLDWLVALALIGSVGAAAFYAFGLGPRVQGALAGERSDFVDKVQLQLKQLNDELADVGKSLSDSSGKLSDSARKDLEQTQQGLKETTAKAEQQLKRAQEATDENWEAAKPQFKQSWQELKDAIGKLVGKK